MAEELNSGLWRTNPVSSQGRASTQNPICEFRSLTARNFASSLFAFEHLFRITLEQIFEFKEISDKRNHFAKISVSVWKLWKLKIHSSTKSDAERDLLLPGCNLISVLKKCMLLAMQVICGANGINISPVF